RRASEAEDAGWISKFRRVSCACSSAHMLGSSSTKRTLGATAKGARSDEPSRPLSIDAPFIIPPDGTSCVYFCQPAAVAASALPFSPQALTSSTPRRGGVSAGGSAGACPFFGKGERGVLAASDSDRLSGQRLCPPLEPFAENSACLRA